MSHTKQFWCFIIVVTLLIICVINWPALQLFLDKQASFPKLWVLTTCGVLNLYIPIWIFVFYFLKYGEYDLKKLQSPIAIYSVFTIIGTGFCVVSLLDAILTAKGSEYIIIVFYLIILTSVQLVSSLIVHFFTTQLILGEKFGAVKSEKYVANAYICGIWLVIITSAAYIIRATIIGCPITLELLISLFGLVCFGFLFLLSMPAFLRQGAPSQLVALACVLIYGLLYFPFFAYWTVRSLIQLHDNISAFEDIGTWMLAFTYFASIFSLVLGALFYSFLGLAIIIGAVTLICFLIMKLGASLLKLCCTHCFPTNNNLNTFLLEDSLLYWEPIVAQTLILDEEKFNPTKHSQTFLEEEVCPVCLDGFAAEQLVTYWPKCEHLFHKECLNYWTKKNPTCPICKNQYTRNAQNHENHHLPSVVGSLEGAYN